jgi:hypothetical protein
LSWRKYADLEIYTAPGAVVRAKLLYAEVSLDFLKKVDGAV